MICNKCGKKFDESYNFCSACGNRLISELKVTENNVNNKKKIYNFQPEFVFSCLALISLFPLIALIVEFSSEPCNYKIWMMIVYFIPYLFVLMFTTSTNEGLAELFTNDLTLAIALIFIQAIIFIIVLLRLIFKKGERGKSFWLSLIMVVVGFILIGIFIWNYLKLSSVAC